MQRPDAAHTEVSINLLTSCLGHKVDHGLDAGIFLFILFYLVRFSTARSGPSQTEGLATTARGGWWLQPLLAVLVLPL